MRNQSTFLGMTRLEAIVLVAVAAVMAMVIVVGMLAHIRSRAGRLDRAFCANNIRVIVQEMHVYAQSNDGSFPCVAPPGDKFVNGLDSKGTPSAVGVRGKKTLLVHFADSAGKQPVGSPLAGLWLLVTTEGISTETFICPSDTIATEPSAQIASFSGKAARYYLNFGMGDNGPMPSGQGESYSIAYPWAHGRAAPWWRSSISNGTTAAAVPLVCDMAPMQDPHAPGHNARDTTQPLSNTFGNYIFNSGNHGGAGQNVGYADDHVVWCTNPYVGVNNDNIFTYGSTGTGGGGTAIAPYLIAPAPQLSDKYPFDTVMVPTRNVQTGRW